MFRSCSKQEVEGCDAKSGGKAGRTDFTKAYSLRLIIQNWTRHHAIQWVHCSNSLFVFSVGGKIMFGSNGGMTNAAEREADWDTLSPTHGKA